MYVDGLVVGASPRISARGGLISYGVDFLDQYSHAAVPAYIPDISGKDSKCARHRQQQARYEARWRRSTPQRDRRLDQPELSGCGR